MSSSNVLFMGVGPVGGVSQLAHARPFLACNLGSSVRLISQCEVRYARPSLPLFLTFLSSVTVQGTVLTAREELELRQPLPLPCSAWTHSA